MIIFTPSADSALEVAPRLRPAVSSARRSARNCRYEIDASDASVAVWADTAALNRRATEHGR
jgi:hypothetical protein